ncbi:IS4 family transposase [Streptomyces sp. NPDC085900]|uniref:IS4 family transposase n=1 Tax=Streptomyces sp. NPDC085900 TaxID=3365737 RepID=UPI0037D93E6A
MKPINDGFSDRIAIGLLIRSFPPDLVDRVIVECGRAGQRNRLLPPRTTVYLVLTMCMFPQASYGQVAHALADGLAWATQAHGPSHLPTGAAIFKARARLGAEPLASLFTESTSATACGRVAIRYGRWRLVGLDGVTLGVPNSAENREQYGPSPAAERSRSTVAQADVIALAECGSHFIARAALGHPRRARSALARDVCKSLASDDLLLADQKFSDLSLLPVVRACGADALLRLDGCPRMVMHSVLPDGSYLCDVIEQSGHRRIRAGMLRVIQTAAQPRKDAGAPTRLAAHTFVTTILDHETAPAHSLVSLFRHRWDLGASLQTFGPLRDGCQLILRSRWPGGVEQELWGYLLVHHAVRSLLHP